MESNKKIMKKKKRKINKFCRLYKYTCRSCGKDKHKRHFAKNGETICPACEKNQSQMEGMATLFDNIETTT